MICVFFFFQAEDGIRDHCVTGVQTCALPISQRVALPWLVLGAFVRIVTHPRASDHPLDPRAAWSYVRSEERRVGKSVDLGGRRRNKKKKKRFMSQQRKQIISENRQDKDDHGV